MERLGRSERNFCELKARIRRIGIVSFLASVLLGIR
jgi:hypothetical protein